MENKEKIMVLGGLIAGEGWIGMKKAQPCCRSVSPIYSVALTISNTNSILISWLIENFGGNFRKENRHSPKHKDGYVWQLQNRKAYPLLKQVLPYLVIKDEQARIVIDYLEHKLIDSATFGRGNKLSDSEIAYRESIYLSLKKLNKKGPSESVETNTSDNPNGLKIESELGSNVENLTSDSRIAHLT